MNFLKINEFFKDLGNGVFAKIALLRQCGHLKYQTFTTLNQTSTDRQSETFKWETEWWATWT
jgi:hypothetical protein